MNTSWQDSYFFDADLAYQTAMQQNRVERTMAVDGLQVCYLGTENPRPDAPPNLIQIPRKDTLNFFANTNLRLPTKVVFKEGTRKDLVVQQTKSFNQMIASVQRKRLQTAQLYAQEILKLHPEMPTSGPMRIFCVASRLTTVMQYSAKSLMNAFAEMGHTTLLTIEQNEMEEYDQQKTLADHLKFNPHLVININHLNNSYLHPDVYNLTWWQDPMPEITSQHRLKWRSRDLVFSFSGVLDDYLYAAGARKIHRQSFCIDKTFFHCTDTSTDGRHNKVVFIGSGVSPQIFETEKGRKIFAELTTLIDNGLLITKNITAEIARKYGYTADTVFWRFLHAALRDRTVTWLCRQQELEVEIYGRYWEYNQEVMPFFKGVVPHGNAVADIYRSSKYALVCHPFDCQSQRLREVRACGCIPIIYDCRELSDPPFFEEQSLFFRTPSQLTEACRQGREISPQRFGDLYSYNHFTSEILKIVRQASVATTKDERRFALILPNSGIYAQFGHALLTELNSRNIEATYIAAKSSNPGIFGRQDIINLVKDVKKIGATDVFTINFYRNIFDFPQEIQMHVWMQDLPQLFYGKITDERILPFAHNWTHLYKGSEFFPPFTNYADFYPPPNQDFDIDISFAGYLPKLYWPASEDPEQDQKTKVLFKIISEKIRQEKIYACIWETGEALLYWAEMESGIYLKKPDLRREVVHHIIQRLVRRVQRVDLAEQLIKVCRKNNWSLIIAGDGWQLFPASGPYRRQYIKPGKELARFYQRSRINLHINGDTNVHPRVMECLACGAFVLPRANVTDNQPGGLFDILDHPEYPCFTDMANLEGKLRYFLEHSDERAAHVEKAGAAIRKKYTIKKAADLLLG